MRLGTGDGPGRGARAAGRAVGSWGLLAAAFLLSARGAQAEDARRYRVDPARSFIEVKVGTAGLFRFAGHDHVVRVPVAEGEIVADTANLGASSVWLRFESARIRVVASEGPADEIPKVQEKMAGPLVLDVARFVEARFESRRVAGHPDPARQGYELTVEGALTLRGTTQPLSARVVARLQGASMVVKGTLNLRQTDYGIQPISVAGLVKVRNELGLSLEIAAAAEGQP